MDRLGRMRVLCGAATGIAGGVVAVAMTQAGGNMARFLPEGPWFHIAALAGAGVAGVTLSDGFGRRGWLGLAAVVVAAPVTTAMGAVLGAMGLLLVAGLVQFIAGMGPFAPEALTTGPALGLIAIGDGIWTSPVVAATWVATMLGVHLVMRRQRSAAAPI
ncbi:hypothetical protein [Tateyamaria sp. SN6-1]|uniref:hypothetical protein n=1 Tax=Tateyamaria sp. SN6-1 TaxID=3092148 RepID=UPI0039F53471